MKDNEDNQNVPREADVQDDPMMVELNPDYSMDEEDISERGILLLVFNASQVLLPISILNFCLL